jgi:hypothetical protein
LRADVVQEAEPAPVVARALSLRHEAFVFGQDPFE